MARRFAKGFTLIEVIIVVGISLAVLAFVLANYARSRNDSVLQREANLLMARLRLTQEQTAAGKTTNFCYHITGTQCGPGAPQKKCSLDPLIGCTTNADCGSSGTCEARCGSYSCCPGPSCPQFPPDAQGNYPHTVPEGGYGMAFSCPTNAFENVNYNYYLFTRGATGYGSYAERRSCGAGAGVANCFPPLYQGFDDTVIASDKIISIMNWVTTDAFGAKYYGSKGDTLLEWSNINSEVRIKDLQITSTRPIAGAPGDGQHFRCLSNKVSPWEGRYVPSAEDSFVPGGYPIQAAVLFDPEDGRTANISDNIAEYPPTSGSNNALDDTNPWQQVDVMLTLVKRNTDCRVVTVTHAGLISQSIDANCDFAT